jgi:hypothetical protein
MRHRPILGLRNCKPPRKINRDPNPIQFKNRQLILS